MREVSAGAILFYNDKQKGRQYLLLQGGKGRAWLFPKGKMDKGETEETAALREILEETGVKDITFIEGFKAVSRYTFRLKGSPLITKKVTFFLAELKSRQVKLSEEHEAYEFVSTEKLDRKRHKFVYTFINQAEKFLKGLEEARK